MCDFFWQRVETTDQGDLADIVRASGVSGPPTSSKTDLPLSSGNLDSWQQLLQSHDQLPASAAAFPLLPADDLSSNPLFGNLRDPLLHELPGTGGGFGSTEAQKICFEDEMNRPCSNLFSRVLQISPNKTSPLSPTVIRPPSTVDHGMQISSPRAPGVKRRKSQTKKVVCIPAPAAASNRSSGEVVPSDLWAWRKYGQKPIKGSPYPRGYYRCSSSKGCSARKQVERSRTDPNMLVITYTSEHNHPWPTQRNALAGSTRAQPSKNPTSAFKTSHHNQRMTSNAMKEELRDTTTTTSTSPSLAIVKEEIVVGETEKAAVDISMTNDQAFDRMFYNGTMMDESNQSDDFFADLAELDPDPMSLIFSRPGFIREKQDNQERDGDKAAEDSFIDIFNWGGSSLGDQAKRGL